MFDLISLPLSGSIVRVSHVELVVLVSESVVAVFSHPDVRLGIIINLG